MVSWDPTRPQTNNVPRKKKDLIFAVGKLHLLQYKQHCPELEKDLPVYTAAVYTDLWTVQIKLKQQAAYLKILVDGVQCAIVYQKTFM